MAYLDHAATTPMLPQALAAYLEAAGELGNASSQHAQGRRARCRVEEARESVAASLGARPSDVVFTAGGTESDNVAVKGIYWARNEADPNRHRIVTTAIEHPAILEAVGWLERHKGVTIDRLVPDSLGRVGTDALAETIASAPDTVALVSVMWANNEVGTVQPVPGLAELAQRYGVPLHTDAVAAAGQVPIHFDDAGVAAMSVSGHKVGGPAGVGALIIRRDVVCAPLLHGGGQERGIRSGTLDVAGIGAFAVAVETAVKSQKQYAASVGALRDELVARVLATVPDAVSNGDQVDRLPSNAHFSFPGCEGDALLMLLDAAGIACSTGSACSAGVARPSHVLVAMGADEPRARSSLRFSLGYTSTVADVNELLAALPAAVDRARRAGRPR
jgi:cysteine desulfurase